jgi:YesN/AraC family two-component response regulator
VNTEKEWQLFKFSVLNIVQEILAEHSEAETYVLRYMEDRLPVLLIDADPEEAVSKAFRLASEIVKSITKYLGIDHNVGIGRWYSAVTQFPQSHRDSVETLRNLVYEGYQKIGYAGDIQSVDKGWPNYPMEQIRQLSDAMQHFDESEVMARWQEIESMYMQDAVSLGYVQMACTAMISRLMLDLMENDPNLLDSQKTLQLIQEIQHSKTKEGAMKLVRDSLARFAELIGTRDLDQGSREGYVEKIISYIREHYQDSVSFAKLAKEMHLTRNYLSYLFKKETGMSFIQYLTKYRIERAKELLQESDLLIYEIAEKVGYSDPAYFSRVFKTITGSSPLEFKNIH